MGVNVIDSMTEKQQFDFGANFNYDMSEYYYSTFEPTKFPTTSPTVNTQTPTKYPSSITVSPTETSFAPSGISHAPSGTSHAPSIVTPEPTVTITSSNSTKNANNESVLLGILLPIRTIEKFLKH